MVEKLFAGLVSLLGTRSQSTFENSMLTYAKTEYKDDWQYAYQYMLSHNGRGPSTGVFK